MRILFTLHNIACRGGSERVVINLANALCEIPNYEISIVSYYTDTKAKEPHAYPINPKVSISYLHNFDDIHTNMRGFRRIVWRWIKPAVINYRMNKAYKNYDVIIESPFSFFYPKIKIAHTKYIKIMHSVIKKWKAKNNYFDCIVFLNEKEFSYWKDCSRNKDYTGQVVKIPNFIPTLPFENTLQKALSFFAETKHIHDSISTLLESYHAAQEKTPYNNKETFLRAKSILKAWNIESLPENNKKMNKAMSKTSNETTNKIHIHTESIQNHPFLQNESGLGHAIYVENTPPPHCHTIIAVGRMDAKNNHKGFPRLIDAYSKIAKQFPTWRLEIIGEDQGQKALLETQIAQLSMQDFILLKPFTNDMESIYLHADIFVMSSHVESQPMVLIEAASFGLPLIAYDIGTIRDCFVNNGILVEDGNEKAFCQALCTLMENEEKRLLYGQNSIILAKQRFSKTHIVVQWRELFATLIQKS